ncbi:MAG: porin [Gammaproteobacteria bacterium]|nr:porin [Gammaproteobacteria bacterium]
MKRVPFFVSAMAAAVVLSTNALASDVTVYGKLHVSTDYVTAGSSTDSHASMHSNSSRLGFKGKEELDHGLTGIWKFESSIDISDAGNTLKARNRYVGLSHSMGQVIFGYHDTPFKIVGGMVETMGDTIGDRRAILGNGAGSNKFNTRAKNTIMYTSPRMGGLQVKALQSLGENKNPDNTDTQRITSVSASYARGDLNVAVAYEDNKLLDATGVRAAAGYTFGGTTLNALYEKLSSDTAMKYDRPAYGFSVVQKIKKIKLNAQCFMADDYTDTAKSGASLLALAASYKLGKKTQVYLAYATVNNNDNSTFVVADGGHGSDYSTKIAGEDPSAVSFGMIHKF